MSWRDIEVRCDGELIYTGSASGFDYEGYWGELWERESPRHGCLTQEEAVIASWVNSVYEKMVTDVSYFQRFAEGGGPEEAVLRWRVWSPDFPTERE